MGRRSEDDCSTSGSSSDDDVNSCYSDVDDSRKRPKQKTKSTTRKESSSKKHKRRRDDDYDKKQKKKRRRHSTRSKHHRDRHDDDHKNDDDNDDEDSSDSSSTTTSTTSDNNSHSERRRRRHERKKEKKRENNKKKKTSKHKKKKTSKHKKKKKSRREKEQEETERNHEKDASVSASALERRNYEIADALFHLLSEHPSMASELPIMLIRLAGGTTFDLSQMTDSRASRGLAQVLASLHSFGVVQDGISGCWVWHGPQPVGTTSGRGGGGRSSNSNNNNNNNELLLIRIVRGVLDQIGMTAQTLDAYEDSRNNNKTGENNPIASAREPRPPVLAVQQEEKLSFLERAASALLLQFGTSSTDKLAEELAGLCSMVLEGESISLDGLPDEKLRNSLESLFQECGLEKTEMEVDSEDDEEATEEATEGEKSDKANLMGYALPDDNENTSREKLAAVIKICRERPPKKNNRRPMQGPLMDPSAYAAAAPCDDSSEDEGPVPRGMQRKKALLALEPDVVEANAAQRALEMECAKAGITPPPSGGGKLGREEWMLVPGKFDFMGSIKSGQPMKSRKFDGKAKSGGDSEKQAMDPAVQAEIDKIMQSHEEARGPSLMELHRQKKAEEAANEGVGQKSWKWNRDKDLDFGRGVDKNALNTIFEGASRDLKNKFQGGFG